jgi:hypothetical protein
MKLGDYSTVEYMFANVQRDSSRVDLDALEMLEMAARNLPQYAERAKAELIRLMHTASLGPYRHNAMFRVVNLYGVEVSPELVRVCREDTAEGSNRLSALQQLILLGYPPVHSLLVERLLREPAWAYRLDIADTLLKRYGTPADYKAVFEYLQWETNRTARNLTTLALARFTPPVPAPSLAAMTVLDSLVSYKHEVYALGWLADADFVRELDGDLQRAGQALSTGDSVGCARSVKTFQDEIDIVYKDSLNPDPRKVTIEGWKFLYYNAQYILDRLPQIPPSPVITSVTPSSATAGSGSFTLTVKGKAFVSGSTVHWNTSARTTSFIADSLLQAAILASDIAATGTASVAVINAGNDTSNTVSFAITAPPPGLIVKLVNSRDARLTDGSLQYYEGGWKDAVNNNDGTFTVITSLQTVSLRMTYAYASQTKSNVTVGPDTVIFQTVNAQVQLRNSQGAQMDTGTVQYYAGAWRSFGTTTSGTASKELLPGNYSFRMTYGFASKDKQQDIGTNPTVVFQTVNAVVQLQNSQGSLIDQGTVQYYSGAWRDFGATSNGIATKELLPNNYSFRMTYAFASKDKQQDIGTNPTVVFQTVNAAVQLQNSQGNLIDQGTVQYYAGAWRDFGVTTNGVVTKELLPNNYSFRMTYAFASKDKQQDIGSNPIVVFQTVNAVVQLKNSQGNLIDQWTVQYYAGAWRAFGSTSNGTVSKELLPGNYSFRMTHEFISLDKAQDISTNNTVSYSTVSCTVRVRNSQNQPVDNAQASYYSGAWRQIGATVNGEVTKELLPVNLTFRINYGGTQQEKVQNLATKSVVEFVVQ